MVIKIFRVIFNLLVLAIVAISGVFAAGHFGLIDFYKPFIVLSGSMSPAIETGSVVLVKPQGNYGVGDIVTFKTGSQTTTHRLNAVNADGTFQTKGDANSDPDHTGISSDQIIGAVNFTIPYLGFVASKAQNPQGFILMVIIPATIIIWEELKTVQRELVAQAKATKRAFTRRLNFGFPLAVYQRQISFHPPPANVKSFKLSPPPKSWHPTPAIALPFLGTVMVVMAVSGSFFLDTEASLGNLLSAASWEPQPSPSPVPVSTVVINEIHWDGGASNVDEWIELYNFGSEAVDISGWSIDNAAQTTDPFVIPPNNIISAGSYFLIANFPETNSSLNIIPDYVTASLSLLEGGELLILRDQNDQPIDKANRVGAWFAGNSTTPASMERIHYSLDGETSASWQTATTQVNLDPGNQLGTPKAPNSVTP